MRSLLASSAALAMLLGSTAFAQTAIPEADMGGWASPMPQDAGTLDAPNFENVFYVVESGLLDNPQDTYEVVFSHVVTVKDAAWLRLFYDKATLVGDSRVRVTSLLDGDVQELNAEILAQWYNTSAYMNGNQLLLELVAAPNTSGNELNLGYIQMQQLIHPAGSQGQCGICGTTDDRTPSSEDFSGRIFPAGCTGSIYTTNSCMVSAGHCRSNNSIIQFRVPASLANCNTVNPPAADQFPINNAGQSQNAGVGADWWVAQTGLNNLGQKAFQRYGALRRHANGNAVAGNPSSIWGFGVDQTCVRSQTQQFSPPGSITVVQANNYQLNNDIRGGNSGSGIIVGTRIVGVLTHCTGGGCPNYGTKHTLAVFANARNAVCPECLADLNGDGTVGQADLAIMLAAYGSSAGDAAYNYIADLDNDNTVGQGDLAILLASYSTNCP